jgi:hypothetical protein
MGMGVSPVFGRVREYGAKRFKRHRWDPVSGAQELVRRAHHNPPWRWPCEASVFSMKKSMHLLFWGVVAVDAAWVMYALVRLLGSGAGSGGPREMRLALQVLLPLVGLLLAIALYWINESDVWRLTVLFVMAGPGVLIAGAQAHSIYIDYKLSQFRIGRGYFSGSAMKAMGESVVLADVAKLTKLAANVDVNAAGVASGGEAVTLLGLAVARALEKDRVGASHGQLAVVLALLAWGAKPDSGMDAALRMRDTAILKALLMAGADPNKLDASRQPIVFRWLEVISAENLRLLGEHGLNINASMYDTPLAMAAAVNDRWDLLPFLIARGADVKTKRSDGRSVAQELSIRIAEMRAQGRTPAAQLLLLQTQLR